MKEDKNFRFIMGVHVGVLCLAVRCPAFKSCHGLLDISELGLCHVNIQMLYSTTVRTNQRWHTTWSAVEDDADIESESVESNQVVVAIVTGHI